MIVISGINLFKGGPLSIYYDCLDAIREKKLNEKFHIVAFVHSVDLFKDYEDIADIIELPKSRKSYLRRMYYEYVYFHSVSKKEHVDIWISLHDMTPRVHADRLYTYCHNASPFMADKLKMIRYGLNGALFGLFYKYIYRINIKSADALIVQQDWMRSEFKKMFPVNQVIVARPNKDTVLEIQDSSACKNGTTIFVYAAFPRPFKNFEIICEACKRIRDEKYEVWLTIDGSENKYAKAVHNKYSDIKQIKWVGIQNREAVFEMYSKASALIFPSKLETWGLPITEFKRTGKDMILVDLPYAYETLGTYSKAMFFAQDDDIGLANLMLSVIKGSELYSPRIDKKIEPPYAENWSDLFNIIFKG